MNGKEKQIGESHDWQSTEKMLIFSGGESPLGKGSESRPVSHEITPTVVPFTFFPFAGFNNSTSAEFSTFCWSLIFNLS